jgi:hypothetical protein
LPVGLALDLLSPEPVWAKSQTAWQARRDTGDSAPLGLALGCSWASRPGPARAQQTAADTAAERADCAVPLAPSWAVARALTVLGAPRAARCPHAQCAHSVHPTPSRLNSDGTGRTKVTVAADGTCALICAASGGLNRRMLRRRSDAPCRNTNTLMLDYHLGNLGGLGGSAGVDGRPGLQRPRAGRGALGAVGVERLQARSTQAAALGRWRVGWGGALARCDGRENTADAFTARSPGCTLATPPGCRAAHLGSPRTARAARPARWC